MGMTAGLVGLGGSLFGMFGNQNTPQNVQLPPMFTMPGMGQAAGGALGGIGNLSQYGNLASGAMPYAQNTFQNLYNNPYAGQFQQGANQASGLGMNAALGAYGTGGAFQGAGLGMLPYAQQIMQTGMDPQNALYNRTVQQLQDQTRAGEAARGIATSPYGAGLENQAMSNFNIDWQNNQLNRQVQAAQGAGGLLNQGANVAGFGTNMMLNAPGQFAQYAGMPYATAAGIGGGQNQAIGSLLGLGSQGQGLANQQIQDYLAYIGAGNQAGSVANQTAGLGLQQQGMGFNQNQMLGGALGSSLYGLGQAFGGGYGGYGGWGGGGNIGPWTGGYGPQPRSPFQGSPFWQSAYNRFQA